MIVVPAVFRRILINKFLEAGAIDKEHAMTLFQLGISENRILDRLIRDDKIIAVGSDKYYLDKNKVRIFHKGYY